MCVLEVEQLRRDFKQRPALRGVSFTAQEGEVVSILGANGAGKTTLIRIISTLLLPSEGRAAVCGLDVVRTPAAVRRRISVVFGGDRGLYGRLSAYDNLRYFGALKGVQSREIRARAAAVFEGVGLAGRERDRVETYSRGMKQRLHLAIGLLTRPALLMLDEPTIGLDVVEARRVRRTVADLAGAGTTILLTSHNVEDLDVLADRVILLRTGVVESDLPMALFRRQLGAVAEIVVTGRGAPPRAAASLGSVTSAPDAGWSLRIPVEGWSADVFDSVRRLAAQTEVVDIDVVPMGLDQVIEHVLQSPSTPVGGGVAP